MNSTSNWDQQNVTDHIRQILRSVLPETKYRTGRPFMTTYQIAIEFVRRFPNEAAALGLATGGEGMGPYALTTYIARWLPDRILNHGVTDIEFCFLSSQHMISLQFEGDPPITATTNKAGFDATMFRMIEGAQVGADQGNRS